MTDPRAQFDRTICDCDTCAALCKTCPGYLIPRDLQALADHLDVKPAYLISRYLMASPGAIVGRWIGGQLQAWRIPTIMPRQRKDRCVWLQADGRCRVHPVAPYGCSHLDSHQTKDEADERSRAGLLSIGRSPAYLTIWQHLWDAGRRSAAPETKRRVSV